MAHLHRARALVDPPPLPEESPPTHTHLASRVQALTLPALPAGSRGALAPWLPGAPARDARPPKLGGNAADPDRVVMWADLEMPRCSVDPEGCYVSMLRGTKALRDEHGCTHVCFPCCTAHQWFDKLSEDVPELETIHMVNKTIEKCESDGRKPLGLLATTLTVKMELWGKEMVIPTETTQARIQEAVESVGTGKTGVLADGTKAVEVLAAAARELEAAGAQAIVLGCTDIGTYCPRDACGVPLVDAMDSLSVAIAECVA